jgi:integrase/recombinase XerD
MRRMKSEGVDLYTALPILSVYLGHDGIASTEKYLRMTAQVYPELIDQLRAAYGDIVPAARKEAAL